MNWLKKKFTLDRYVQVERNKFCVKVLNSDRSDFSSVKAFFPSSDFTTERLLVGNFREAQNCLKPAILAMAGKTKLQSLRVLIQPMVMTEGGLCEVEERIFYELALGAGAAQAKIFTGSDLAAADVAAELA